MKKNLKLKPIKDSLIVPKVINRIFPIETFYAHNGVIKVGEKKYSICAVFKSLKFKSESEASDVLIRYKKLLNNLAASVQFYFSNQSLENYNLYEMINLKVDEEKERISYIVLTTEAESVVEAENVLFNEMKKVKDIFEIKLLSIEEYINIIYHFYNPVKDIKKGFFSDLFIKGIEINDVFNSGDPEFERGYLKIDEIYIKYFYIRELPESVEKSYITELFKQNFEISVSMHVNMLNKDKVTHILNEKYIMMKKEMEYEDFIPFEIARKENEENLIGDEFNEEVFNVGVVISTMASNYKELEKNSDIIMEICKKYKSNAELLTHQTENSLASMMPIGNDKVNIRRILKDNELVKLIYI